MKYYYRNKRVDREPKAAEVTRRGDRPGWIDRRFAKRLFSLLLVISLLSNTLGFVTDDLMPVQGRQASAEILEIDTGVGGMASNDISDGLDLEDSLEDLTNDGLDQIGDLSLSQGLVSNGQGSEKTYVYHMQGETRLLLSDLVQKLNLPVRDMQFVGNVILMSNEQDPALDMSLFVQIVALDKNFLFCLKPLFRDVRLTVYTTDGTFILRLVNDMTLKPEDVTLAAQTLAQNPTPFDAVFSYDFARKPARIRLSRLLQRVGLPIKLKSIAEVGVVEHIGLEGQVLAIEKAKNDYVLTARHPFNEIELAVFTDTASYSIALLNGRAVGGDEGEEPLDFPTDISASGVSVSDSLDLPDDAIQDPSALELLDMPELDQGALIDAEPEIEQAEAPVAEPEVEQAEAPVTEPEVEQTEAPVAEPEVEQAEEPVAEPEVEQTEAPVAEPEIEQAEAVNRWQMRGYVPFDKGEEYRKIKRTPRAVYHTKLVDEIRYEENLEYLDRIASLCLNHHAELILVSMPMSEHSIAKYVNLQEIHDFYQEYAAQNDLTFIDFNLWKDKTVYLQDQDYQNATHLGNTQAPVFTEQFSRIMKDYFAGKDISGYFYPDFDALCRDRGYVNPANQDSDATLEKNEQ